jgi:hypothetical protein
MVDRLGSCPGRAARDPVFKECVQIRYLNERSYETLVPDTLPERGGVALRHRSPGRLVSSFVVRGSVI